MNSPTRGPVTSLDVRPMLATGKEPFDAIMAAVADLPADGILEITAPFEPVPLYTVFAARGLTHVTEQRSPSTFVVRFFRLAPPGSAT